MRLLFEGFWPGFPKHHNIITKAFQLCGNLEIVNSQPDVVIHCGPGDMRHHNAVTIAWFIESMNRIGEPDYQYYDYSFNSCYFDDPRNYRIPFWATQINWLDASQHDLNRGPTYYVSMDEMFNRRVEHRDRLCSSMSSSPMGRRGVFYPKISQTMKVVHGGDFLRNTSEVLATPGNSDYLEKLQFIERFKAHLCFENDARKGYVCEKILHAFIAGCVPIYWGPSDVGEEFNKEAFIDISDFNNDEEAIEYIVRVLNDNDRVTEYLRQPIFPNNTFPTHATPEALSEFLNEIL